MITCTKLYADIPFAHRQHKHDGHCALIHGHNWGFEFTFGCTDTDANGFVIDFGKLGWLKAWLERFDHALVLCDDDPQVTYLLAALHDGDSSSNPTLARLARILVVPSASCEGLAVYVAHFVARELTALTEGRVSLQAVTIYEDSKNSATWRATT